MTNSTIKITRRHLPHWSLDGAMYFVTCRVSGKELTVEEQIILVNHIKAGHDRYYSLIAIIALPDHFHIILTADKGYDLSQIMKGIKGASARKINSLRKARGSIWQTESFDRIIRNNRELAAKLRYMLNNPLKAGLTTNPSNYHGWYWNENYFQR